MKTITLTESLPPTVIIGALLITAIALLANSIHRPAFLADLRVDMIIILVLGMMMCTTGIGKVAVVSAWASPFSILGYLFGLAILTLGASVIFHFKLPYVPNDFNALVAVAILIGMKVVISIIHNLIMTRQ